MAPFFRPEPKLSTMQTAAALLIETKLALGPPVGRVFVSYSHGDAKFVDQLVHKFKRAGITYFRDKDHLVAGKMERQIAREIAERDAFVLALSERSLKATGAGTKSNSQENGKSRDQIDYLFPITLDDAWFNTEKYDAGVQKAVADHQVEISFLKKNFLLLSMDGRKFKESFERLLDGLRNNREGKYISPY